MTEHEIASIFTIDRDGHVISVRENPSIESTINMYRNVSNKKHYYASLKNGKVMTLKNVIILIATYAIKP